MRENRKRVYETKNIENDFGGPQNIYNATKISVARIAIPKRSLKIRVESDPLDFENRQMQSIFGELE